MFASRKKLIFEHDLRSVSCQIQHKYCRFKYILFAQFYLLKAEHDLLKANGLVLYLKQFEFDRVVLVRVLSGICSACFCCH